MKENQNFLRVISLSKNLLEIIFLIKLRNKFKHYKNNVASDKVLGQALTALTAREIQVSTSVNFSTVTGC